MTTDAGCDPFDQIEAFYEAYGRAFTACDLDAIDALFEYPYLLTNSSGSVEMPDRGFYAELLGKLKSAGWIGSRVGSFKKVRMGRDGAAIIVDYRRIGQDGETLGADTAAYFLHHRPDGWKLIGICDGYGGNSSGAANFRNPAAAASYQN